VDSGFVGGPFAPEASFTYVPPPLILQNSNFGLSTAGFGFDFTGQPGRMATVEASRDLVDWTALTNTLLTSGISHFTDTAAGLQPVRFYRVILH
jgi:hypothetical protein